MQDRLDALCKLVMRHAAPGGPWPLPRVRVGVRSLKTDFSAIFYDPMLCLVLQGAKQVMIGDQTLRYDPASFFIASLDLPASGRIVEASRDRPCVAVGLTLDIESVATLIGDASPQDEPDAAGFAVSLVTPALLDAWSRLLGLLDEPAAAPVIAPLIEREILFRLLQGPQGATLRQMASRDSRLSRIRRTITSIRAQYDQPMMVSALAECAGMSIASFHRHFKAATGSTPLQYQKALRLQAARRLLLTDHDACRAGFAVGYESASQFSREYARQFGLSPARDALRIRASTAERTLAPSHDVTNTAI